MNAAVIVAPQRVALREQAAPEPGPGQVRVRLRGCGVCGSNLPVWEGRPWFEYPLAPGAPGHEGWGVIDAVGEGVAGWAVGTPVATLSQNAYAEMDLSDAGSLVRLPDALADRPVPGEPLACALNVFRRSDIRAGQHVAIVGVGFLGALLAQLAVREGARVIAISRRRFARDVAAQCGARHVLAWDDDVPARIDEITGGGCPRVIEAVGTQAALDLASRITAVRGRLVIAGYHQDGARQVNMQAWNWNGLDVINAHERDTAVYVGGLRAAVDAVASGRLDFDPLLTHRFRLGELGKAFELMRNRPDGFLKAWVSMEGD